MPLECVCVDACGGGRCLHIEARARATQSFSERYLEPFGDVRYYTWRAVTAFTSRAREEDARQARPAQGAAEAARNAYDMMCLLTLPASEARKEKAGAGGGGEAKVVEEVRMAHLVAAPRAAPAVPAADDVAHDSSATPDTPAAPGGKRRKGSGGGGGGGVDLGSKGVYAKAFSDAWIGLMRLQLPPDVLKSVLIKLHSDILPHLTQPLLLADVLSDCYARGGILSVCAPLFECFCVRACVCVCACAWCLAACMHACIRTRIRLVMHMMHSALSLADGS